MKKKEYLQPSVSVMDIDDVRILAGSDIQSTSVKGNVEGDDLDFGGETKEDQTYTPW